MCKITAKMVFDDYAFNSDLKILFALYRAGWEFDSFNYCMTLKDGKKGRVYLFKPSFFGETAYINGGILKEDGSPLYLASCYLDIGGQQGIKRCRARIDRRITEKLADGDDSFERLY